MDALAGFNVAAVPVVDLILALVVSSVCSNSWTDCERPSYRGITDWLSVPLLLVTTESSIACKDDSDSVAVNGNDSLFALLSLLVSSFSPEVTGVLVLDVGIAEEKGTDGKIFDRSSFHVHGRV